MKTLLASFAVFIIFLCVSGFIFIRWGSNLNWLINIFNRPNYERWVSQFDAFGVASNDVVFLGDSLTEWGIWQEMFPGLPIRNRGIAADDTQGVLDRLDSITKGKPAKIFLMIGTNDLMGGVEEQTIVNNIVKIVERVHNDSPGTEIYVQSILPRRPSYTSRIRSINPKIKSAIAGKAEWIDLFPLFISQDGTRINPDLSNDKIHLTVEGYFVWRNAIHEQVVANVPREHTP